MWGASEQDDGASRSAVIGEPPLPRRNRSRLRRQIVLALIALAIVGAVWAADPTSPGLARLSLGTAYSGLAFLAASLVVGPLELIRGRRPPPSTYLRRDIGITAGILALVHVAVGLQVHLGGDMVSYFFHRDPAGHVGALRADVFGFANHTGLLAALVFLLLLSLSNNASLRALKARRWKGLQRTAYAAALLVFAHGALYQVLERQRLAFVTVFLLATAIAAAAQLAGLLRHRRDHQGTSP